MGMSVLVAIIIIASFTGIELKTEPSNPNIPVIPNSDLHAFFNTFLPHGPLNNFTGPVVNPANVTSEINVSYGGSHASFLFLLNWFDESFKTTTREINGPVCYGPLVIENYSIDSCFMKTSQKLSFPVTGFTFSISDFNVSFNRSTLKFLDTGIFRGLSYAQEMGLSSFYPPYLISFEPPLFNAPFNFTIGNLSAVNRFYYVNYSFYFTPIVEVGFIHYALKPVFVSNYYLAPWGFKTPQKPWWER